jgi:hypothetical protein
LILTTQPLFWRWHWLVFWSAHFAIPSVRRGGAKGSDVLLLQLIQFNWKTNKLV